MGAMIKNAVIWIVTLMILAVWLWWQFVKPTTP